MALEWYTFFLLALTFTYTAVDYMPFSVFWKRELSCVEFFRALKNVRDDVFSMPYKVNNNNMVDRIEEHVQNTMGGSMYNDTVLETLACDIVDANTVEELAVVLRLDQKYVEIIVNAFSQNATGVKRHFDGELLKYRAWLVSSSFPDTWPLMTNFRENLIFVNTCKYHDEVFFRAGYGLTVTEKARILSESKSLDGYFKALIVNPADSDVKQKLQMIKFLASAKGGVAVTKAAKSTAEFREVMGKLPVVKKSSQWSVT